ncbi:DUF1799 domain-containing protein [Stenotrophomonas tuberculopleuritidis]|uniref:DUF1799 domain-containing protein n=1 Tax=Stenotrophomonas tuberculopleuritidis TaxID=3055079 RepID=UPI0026E5814A|nr:DUF1799 domain-containing protein [Stenotrophomonas sp. 704A1]
MGALYWRAPTEAELNQLGLKAKHFPPPQVELWPECALPIDIFSRVSTQWRIGAGGPTGLDYNVVYQELEREGLTAEKHAEAMAGIRVIERAALDEMHRQ